MRFALLTLCVASPLLLSACGDESGPAPADIEGHLTHLTEAVATLEQAIESQAPADHLIHLAGNVRRLAAIEPDETWTDPQRRRLLDLLKRIEEVGAPAGRT